VISTEEKAYELDLYGVYTVKFPSGSKEYVLVIMAGGLSCLNPDGKTQQYCIESFNCD